ncbi:MAG TPA: winged helix-turn-helix domain-containing protein [Caulobacteraceae bacterium]|nr:winged helix-turn-helix domain-containing protein [Caulobacteraceae bacterium]
MAAVGDQRPFWFGAWRVDPARGALTSDAGEVARLEPRLMDLLVLFAGSGGRVLSKDEIVEAVWEGRAIGDDTLAAAISRLRRTLGETRERRYIETSPKRGYRAVPDTPAAAPSRAATAGDGPAEAETLVAQGRRALASPLPQNLAQALLYFEDAVRQAPSYAPAHQGLADALIARHLAGGEPAHAAAKAAAHAAVGLDGASAGAWSTLGMALLLADRDFAAADAALQRAVAVGPGLPTPHRQRAFAFATVGRFVEAEREARRAVELAPASLEPRGDLLQLLLTARRYRHAAAEAAAVIAIAPAASEAWYAKGWALALAGDEEAGLEALLKGFELWGAEPERLESLRGAFRAGGLAAAARAAADIFTQQQVLLPRRLTDVAMLRTLGGQRDAAFEALERALAKDDYLLLLFPWLPYFDALKPDPRYAPFVKRLRLVR